MCARITLPWSKDPEEENENIGRNVLRSYAKESVWPACAIAIATLVYGLVSYNKSQTSAPMVVTVDSEGSATLSALDGAKGKRKSYIRTAEEFAHALMDHSPTEVMPSDTFNLICTPECAAQAAKNWPHTKPQSHEYQLFVKKRNKEFTTALGIDEAGVGTVKIQGLLIRQNLSSGKDQGIEIDNWEMTVHLINSSRLHTKYITPYLVESFTFETKPAN